MDEAELLKRLLETFRVETEEHLNTIAKGMIELEKKPDKDKKKDVLEEIYRAAHSMKGASRAVGLTDIEKLCQALESCFSLMKKNELETNPQIFDIFHSVLNIIEVLMEEDDEDKPGQDVIVNYINLLNNIKTYETAQDEPSDNRADTTGKSLKEVEDHKTDPKEKESKPDTGADADEIENQKNNAPEPIANSTDAPSGSTAKPAENAENISRDDVKQPQVKENKKTGKSSGVSAKDDTVRLSTEKISTIYLAAEESLQIKLSHDQEINQVKKIIDNYQILSEKWAEVFSQVNKNRRDSGNKDQHASGLNGDFYSNCDMFNGLLKSTNKEINALLNTSRYVKNTAHNILDNLVDEIKHILMVPFSNLLDGYPRIVRDLSKELNKKVELEISGTNVEVDRRIMERLKDPLIHLIRNSIDHGIEKESKRIKAGKNPTGKVEIHIQQKDANHVKIQIRDDGAGISTKKLVTKAVDSNIISKDEASKLSKTEALELIFKSGVSTASIITDISGRGLGLAIVEEKIEKLDGKITIDSEENTGTTFTLEIPTTISKSQGLIILVNNKRFIIPVSNILETLRIRKTQLKKVENRDTIQYANKMLPLIPLADTLEMSVDAVKDTSFVHIVIVESLSQRIGFIVDEIDNEQEVLFKQLSYPLQKVRNIAGVSLLGTGKLCPILNCQDLVRSAIKSTSASSIAKDAKGKGKSGKQKAVLMAEDSITSRLFLKNILEGAGYKVKACVDGKEAFTALKINKYDILVSDIEMPRMNGFELTEAIRKDDRLSDLPIVLVTSLSKKEDQERGIEVGANAYIIKSSFEQSNLLAVIKRLI